MKADWDEIARVELFRNELPVSDFDMVRYGVTSDGIPERSFQQHCSTAIRFYDLSCLNLKIFCRLNLMSFSVFCHHVMY